MCGVCVCVLYGVARVVCVCVCVCVRCAFACCVVLRVQCVRGVAFAVFCGGAVLCCVGGSVVKCCVVCGAACHAERTLRAYVQHAFVCTFPTSPCVPAIRAHAFQHVGVSPVHTGMF